MKDRIQNYLEKSIPGNENLPYRQKFHLMADMGWISDPNGLCQHKGISHIFHQYTPSFEKQLWKSWGHWTTKDWIHFKDEGTLMCPESWMDKDGCYSGSGYVKDDVLHLFYTGNILEEGDYDYINEGRGHVVNHLSSSDGIHFSEKENLLKNSDYPSHMSCHVRDPKVTDFKNRTMMVLGARTKDSKGCALLYECDPEDVTKMTFVQQIDSDKPFGYMWECPDLFELDGHDVLICCPQGVETQGIRYENIYQNGWFDIETDSNGQLHARNFHELDHGFDFYAPQTMIDEKGRRILIGWMGMPDAAYTSPEAESGWVHCLSLPRKLSFKNGRICQYPIEELKSLRRKENPLILNPLASYPMDRNVFELHLDTGNEPFDLRIRKDASISWDGHILTFSMKESGAGRDERHVALDHLECLDIFSDVSSLEIFINKGEHAISSRIYDENQPLRLSVNRKMKGILYDLDSLKFDYSEVLSK